MNETKSVLICFISLIMLLMLTRSRQHGGLYSVSLSGFRVESLPRSLFVLIKAAGTEID